MILYKQNIETPIGKMITFASEKGICLLEFDDRKGFDKQIEKTIQSVDGEIREESILHIDTLKEELDKYFSSKLKYFSVSLHMIGTDFQLSVWNELLNIPYGKTISYKEQALNINSPSSVRAVANANGKNKLAIIVPCHRVIGYNGSLTGYAGGIDKKRFLLNLESKCQKNLFD